MLTEEQAANAYEEVTDLCRRLVRVTSDNAPQWQRVKPDTETHLSAFNYRRCSRSGSRQPQLPRRVVAPAKLQSRCNPLQLDDDIHTSS
jgi:hypothetical protein